MQPTLCSRCKKNVAVVFISKMEGDKTTNEGLCLKCAKELGLPQVDDMMKRFVKKTPELMGICDRIMVMCEGNYSGEVSREEFSQERIMTLASAIKV